jgi:PEGA domain
MTRAGSPEGAFTRFVLAGGVAVLAFVAARPACAQATVEAATTTASAGVATSEVKRLQPVILATPKTETGSPHLIAHDGPPADEANRKALEEQAGSDAAKLLMRSSPSGAQIYINGAFVGHTPLLLMLAPGQYKVEMRDERDDIAQRTLGLLANDTQAVTLKLTERYPARVSTR